MFYRQLPARSPLPGAVFPRVARYAFTRRSDPRLDLRRLLLRRYRAVDGVLCASGTHALQIALSALRDNKRPVLLPAYTCYEVATAAIGAQVAVALYDVDPNTLEPDWNSMRAAAKNGAAGIVVASLFGQHVDWQIAREICDESGALLIEDAAQAHGASWRGNAVGAVGDVTILSFGRGKGWTGGGGGALLWRGRGDAAMRAPNVGLSAMGLSRTALSAAKLGAQWLLARPGVYGLPASIPVLHLGETVYHEPTPPAGMTRLAAAVLLATDQAASDEAVHRRSCAIEYASSLADGGANVTAVIGANDVAASGALRFPIRYRGGWPALYKTRAPVLGAAPGYPTTLGALKSIQPICSNALQTFSGAELLARELVTLPTHSGITTRQRRQLIGILGATRDDVVEHLALR